MLKNNAKTIFMGVLRLAPKCDRSLLMNIGGIKTLFLWILKSSDFGISTISSDSQSKMSQESKKIRSRDRRIFEKNPYYEIKTLTHNNVNTVSDRSN